jgi:hypothetical protein
MLRSRFHHAVVKDTDLEYDGSISVNSELLEKAGMLEHEQARCSVPEAVPGLRLPSALKGVDQMKINSMVQWSDWIIRETSWITRLTALPLRKVFTTGSQ